MDFTLTDEQEGLRRELRRTLARACPPEVRRAAMALPGAVDLDLWRTLADLGVFDLLVPGDDRWGLAGAVVAFEEIGRAAVPGPVVATTLAATLTATPALAPGGVVGVVEARPPVLVEHLDALDALVVLTDDGLDLVAPGAVTAQPLARPLDPLTPVSLVTPAGLPAGERVGGPAEAARWRRDGGLLHAAVQVGLGAAALDLAVGYAKIREQFGRQIGSFQALKHMLADAYVAVEMARVAVQAAAVEADEGAGGPRRERAAAAARILASRAAATATADCVQVHGGIGYTWELDAHLYLKRALVLDTTPGSVDAAYGAMTSLLAAASGV